MLVKDVMITDVKTIEEESTIQEAAKRMSEFSIGSLIVVVDSRVVGIITERDILKKVVAEGRDCRNTPIKDVMTKEVIMVKPDIDIHDAADIMMEKKIKKLHVIEDNSLVGIITVTDICNASPKMIEQLGETLLTSRKKKAVAG